MGGRAIEGAGRIWYAALTGGDVPPGADFAAFAAATVAAAGEHADAVREAWAQVGVAPGAAGTGVPPVAPAGRLRVERSGGFVGRTDVAEVDLDDPAEPDLPALVARALAQPVAKASSPRPDMYLYTFTVSGGVPVSIPEHLMSDTQRELARRLLDGNHDV